MKTVTAQETLDDGGHLHHLVVGGLVVATDGVGDGVLIQSSLQESVAKCTTSIEERN